MSIFQLVKLSAIISLAFAIKFLNPNQLVLIYPRRMTPRQSNIKVEQMTYKTDMFMASPCPFSPKFNLNLQRDTALTYSHKLNFSFFPVNLNSQPVIYTSSHFSPSPPFKPKSSTPIKATSKHDFRLHQHHKLKP